MSPAGSASAADRALELGQRGTSFGSVPAAERQTAQTSGWVQIVLNGRPVSISPAEAAYLEDQFGPNWKAIISGADAFAAQYGAGAGGGRQAFTVPAFRQAPDQEVDLRIQRQAQAQYGRDLQPGELAILKREWRVLEKQAHDQMVAQARAEYGGGGGGQTITEPPAPEVFAEARLKELKPEEAGAQSFMQKFSELIGFIQGNRGSI